MIQGRNEGEQRLKPHAGASRELNVHRARTNLCKPWMAFHFPGLDKEPPRFPEVEKEEAIEAIYLYDPTQNLLLALLPSLISLWPETFK